MFLGTCGRTMLLAAGIGQLCGGCGQNTPEDLDFTLRPLSFEVSNASAQWRQAPANLVPNLVCAGPQALVSDCCSPPAPAAAVDCQQYPVACDPASNFCALTFDVEQAQEVNLVAGVPAIAAVDGRVFTRVFLTWLGSVATGLDTSATDLDELPIRSANLYIGPAGMGSSSNPAARLLAPVSLVPGESPLPLGAGAQEAFSSFARDYRAPFSLLLSTHLVIPSGVSPAVKVTFRIDARAEAWY
jgi:hypothetical protein